MESNPEPCWLCGNPKLTRLFYPTRSPGPVVRCGQCGMVFISPVLNPDSLIFDGPVVDDFPFPNRIQHSSDEADIQDSWELPFIRYREEQGQSVFENYARSIERLSIYGKKGKLLDYGCGPGFVLKVASEAGWEPYGLEPLPAPAVYARSRFKLPVVNDVLRDDTFPSNFFDAITSFQVFEHIPRPLQEMQRLVRFLKPGGLLLVEVPNIDNWFSKVLGRHSRHFVADHLHFYSKNTLSIMMDRCGMDVVSVVFPKRVMTLQHLSDWVEKLLPLYGKINQSVRNRPFFQRLVSISMGDIIEVIGKKGSTEG